MQLKAEFFLIQFLNWRIGRTKSKQGRPFDDGNFILNITTDVLSCFGEKCRRKISQLCLWTSGTVTRFVFLSAGFLCPKCDNFTYLHICQDLNVFHLKRWFFWQNITMIFKVMSQYFPALFKHIRNHIRSAEE